MSTVLILGGYGAVGREAALALAGRPGTNVIVAGRNPDRARPIAGVTSVRVDAADPADLTRSLEGVTTVLMCAEIGNAVVARTCLERGIGYVDVSASPDVLAAIEELDGLAAAHGATAALSVGLVPGVSNLLARVVAERSPESGTRIGVLLGSGEQHGSAAIAWTLDGLGVLEGSWPMDFPEPYGARTVHRFPFSDQYTLPRTIGVPSARTGLCLDSRLFTTLLAAARRPAVARLLRRPRVRELLLRALANIHIGSDGFAVTVSAGAAQVSFSGHSQSRATGRVAALLVRHLPGLPAGVRHIEQLVDPIAFLTGLAADGFVLDVDG
ncbi:Glutamyl-tRNA reductase [Nonomuraea coxensis DSM 45129]|uniref:Glutamyl-tRNA reductase n=1 Tax=Nonomuraea coxensis DSM 45129 TaxID=1122611 RepID=A0ABX8U4N3_9ACTN|nr:saccharopine dehydrogenase NADP-binding domain-containing protein [Nonomuraea coxensis]QYC41699.1 Glutamyl-tRNA reductase [Nonomuraea coxensis DSM 45129]